MLKAGDREIAGDSTTLFTALGDHETRRLSFNCKVQDFSSFVIMQYI